MADCAHVTKLKKNACGDCATSASSPISTRAKRPRPSASSTTPARPTGWATSTRARPSPTGWCRSANAASPFSPRPSPASGKGYQINIIDTPGPHRLHRRGAAQPARPRRRRRRLRRGCRRRAPVRDGLAAGQPLRRAAHLLRQQDGSHRREFLAHDRYDQGPPRRKPAAGAAAHRLGRPLRGHGRPDHPHAWTFPGRPGRHPVRTARARLAVCDEVEELREQLVEKIVGNR